MGLVDCLDIDCVEMTHCSEVEACADGVDNDGDGATDCDDFECLINQACP